MTKARYKFIDGAIYARDTKPYSHDIRVHDLGNEQIEVVVSPRYAWSELDATPGALEAAAKAQTHYYVTGENGGWFPTKESPEEAVIRAERNRERSARRARTEVRRIIKHRNLDTMLTLTYRENMTDRARMGRDFDVFMKRVRRVFPGFHYVCVFEQQKRGAWHAHMAVAKLQSHYWYKGTLVKSWDLMRAIWRRVVGADNGNVDFSASRGRKRGSRSVARLASYLSKYLGKTFAEGGQGDSYRASGKKLPKALCFRSHTTVLESALGDLAQLLRPELLSLLYHCPSSVHQCYLDGGGYYLALSP